MQKRQNRNEAITKAIQIMQAYKEINMNQKNNRAFWEAIEALEKQIRKKPTCEGDGYTPDGSLVLDEWLCPRCNFRYELDYEEHNYCPNCGQAIDWSDME